MNITIKQLTFVTVLFLFTQLISAQSMHDAIKNGNLKKVKSLLKSKPELLIKKYPIEKPLNIWSTKEISPLYDAILYGRIEIVQYLIKKGVDLKKDDDAIYLAVVQKEEKIKHLLFKNGAGIYNDTTAHYHPNILTQAVVFNPEIEILEELIELGASVNVDWGVNGNYSHTPLGMATRSMFPKAVKLMIENDAKVNLQRNWGRIGLHDAITYSKGIPKNGYSPEVLYCLLENGGDKNHRDFNGDTPFEYAAIKGVTLALKILWDSTYDVTQTNFDGMTLLHRTVIKGYYDNVDFLISKGFNLNILDNYGNTPLFYAYKYRHEKIADLLKSKGGKTDIIPNTESISSLLNKKLKIGQAYIWHLGKLGWVIKTNNHLIIKTYDWNEVKPDNPSLANGSLVSKELFNQNIICFGYGFQKNAEALVAKEPYLKTVSKEKKITYLFSSKASESKHINSIKINDPEKKEIENVMIQKDNGNWLFIADDVKILFNGYRQPKNEQFIEDAKNPDISFLSVSGGLGDLSEEETTEVESNIKIYQPKMMFFQSIYTNDYRRQKMRNKLKERECKIELPVAKFPGDFFFYDASIQQNKIIFKRNHTGFLYIQ